MSTVSALSVYAIRREVDGQPVTDFDEVIVPDRLSQPGMFKKDFSADDNDWSARLFMWPGDQKPPPWLAFVEDGFGGELTLPDSAQSSAVIVVRVFFRRDRYYAVSFGGGRHAIRRGAIDPKYGLQVALNAIYEGDEETAILDVAARVQQVNTRTVAANTMRTLRQTNRSAEFDVFELDPDGDQLDGITGNPVDTVFGRRVRGTDSVRLGRSCSFRELGRICRNLARYHERNDYQRRFRFVDDIKAETNTGQISDLNDAVTAAFLDDADAWALAPPGLLDFDRVDYFEVPDLGLSGQEISAAELSATLVSEGIDSAEEMNRIKLLGKDGEGAVVDQWPVLSCLDGQIEFGGNTFLVDGGSYHKISTGYMQELDDYVAGIHRSAVALPPSIREPQSDGTLHEITEGAYNQFAADSSRQHILLDKKLVKITAKTSPIEVCDVLTLSGQMVHVKRKFSSSSLSHLFAQGFVSSELLSDNEEYRRAIREEIGPANADFQDLFPDKGLVTGNFEIVYAIVGAWEGKALTDIPFFSKVNLRRYRRALRRLQYQVTYADVPVIDPPP